MRKEIELLAPAGTWEALEAAVNAGANAVYLGGKAFGARAYASNFDREEMGKAVYFCHMHHVRLYVTVNTLVDDKELPELEDGGSYQLEFSFKKPEHPVDMNYLGVMIGAVLLRNPGKKFRLGVEPVPIYTEENRMRLLRG